MLSSTNGAESHSLAAAIATMQFYQRENVIGFLYHQGERLSKGIQRSIEENRIEEYFGLLGRHSNIIYATKDAHGQSSAPFRTLFLQETLSRGLLAPSLCVSYSHTDAVIDKTVEIIHEALVVYKKALSEGIEKYLVGRPVQQVYRRFNSQQHTDSVTPLPDAASTSYWAKIIPLRIIRNAAVRFKILVSLATASLSRFFSDDIF